MADLMGNRGLILAADLDKRRLRQLMDNCQRLGITCARPVLADGRNLTLRQVDGVLVDAPCSGLGVLARRADLRWKKEEQDISRLAQLQLELMRNAADMLKKGGRLVYSTCTIEDEENEAVLSRLLSERADVAAEEGPLPLPGSVITPEGYVRTFPHQHGVDGIFAARLKRVRAGDAA
jgi:16S rRNA (cytosine967-C5)-methyltransferase